MLHWHPQEIRGSVTNSLSLLPYAFLRTEGKEDGEGGTTNPKGLSQTHTFIQVLTSAPIPHGTWMAKYTLLWGQVS